MKNFPLNKAMKEKLAYDLAAKAVEKKMRALEKKLVTLNIDFWTEHNKRVAEMLQIPVKRYDELIQAGALVSTTTISALNANPENAYCDDEFRTFASKMQSRNGSNISDLITRDGYSYRRITIRFKSAFTVPTISSNSLKLANDPHCKYHQRSVKLLTEYVDMIKAARKFHSELSDLLHPVRSYSRLLDSFPEAAKLITAPVKSTTEILPKQMIDTVREQLAKGIPL